MSVFPSWRYGPNGEGRIFNSQGEVPEGWSETPITTQEQFDPFSDVDIVFSASRRVKNLTPSDNTLLPHVPKAIYIGTGGDLVVRGVDDDTDTLFRNLPSGCTLAIRIKMIRSNGTTASNIVGMF
jgi:hypothetical protein